MLISLHGITLQFANYSAPFPGLVKKKEKTERARKTLGLGYFHPSSNQSRPSGSLSPPPSRGLKANDLFQRPLGFDINDFSGPGARRNPGVTLPANFSPSTPSSASDFGSRQVRRSKRNAWMWQMKRGIRPGCVLGLRDTLKCVTRQ